MPVEEFEEQIRILIRYSNPLALNDIFAGARAGTAVTFDDGYANNYLLAFPILQKYRFPATIFVTTGFVDRTVPLWSDWLEFLITRACPRNTVFEYQGKVFRFPLTSGRELQAVIRSLKQYLSGEPIDRIHDFLLLLERHLEIRYDWDAAPEELRPLTWEQMRIMKSSGIVSFGAHTVSHPVLSRCTEAVQKFEVAQSCRRLKQELGEEDPVFAYPYGKQGHYTEVTRQIVQECGYKAALTAIGGSNLLPPKDWYELRRWGADVSADDLSYLVSGAPALTRPLMRW